MGNSETLLYLLVNILVLHQSHKVIFYHGIYKILLFDESNDHFLICELWTKKDNCIRSLSYWCFFVALVFLSDIKSANLLNCLTGTNNCIWVTKMYKHLKEKLVVKHSWIKNIHFFCQIHLLLKVLVCILYLCMYNQQHDVWWV